MRESQRKSLLLCVLAFVVGLLVVVSIGCSVSSQTKIKAGIKPITYPHDLTYPVTEYDLDKVVTLEIECCKDCGFAPWTDSWCEFHFGM
jgi:hypothetical protein